MRALSIPWLENSACPQQLKCSALEHVLARLIFISTENQFAEEFRRGGGVLSTEKVMKGQFAEEFRRGGGVPYFMRRDTANANVLACELLFWFKARCLR